MVDWYNCIEPGIKSQVKLLRDNGFNTECSCEHKMYVQCQLITDGELMRLDRLLFNNGFRDYIITFEVKRIEGHIYSYMNIKFEQ